MSVYTTEVRYICEYEAGLTEHTGFNNVDSVIEKSWDKIFIDFPIFNESYRKPLCKKILQHYYTREICAETIGLWKFWLNQKMYEIMPYYNKLYESEQLKFDPFSEIDLMKEIIGETSETKNTIADVTANENNISNSIEKGTASNTATGNTSATNAIDSTTNAKTLHSDTPQGGITGLENGNYLTDAEIKTDTTAQTNTTDSNTTTTNNETNETSTSANDAKNKTEKNSVGESGKETKNYAEHTHGKQSSASYASLLNEYRTTFLNIDMEIILELKDLFMNIY